MWSTASSPSAVDSREVKGKGRVDVLTWLLRACWVSLPFTGGPALGSAVGDGDFAVGTVVSVLLWVGWAIGVVAVLIPHPIALTAIRFLTPATVLLALPAVSESPLGLAAATLALGSAYGAPIGFRWVNGPAYPNERRFLLRVPGALLFGPLLVFWALTLAGVCAGPLLLADGQWAAGAISLVLGLPISWYLARSIHNLSRRWAVFVPAGMVLHDPMSLVDPVLFTRQRITALQPARVGGDGLDLTQGSLGLALDLTVEQPVSLGLLKLGQRFGRTVDATTILFTPTRPGDVLDEARRARIAVGGQTASR